uniref:Uncharacterized protein n=1 Tax=Fagus sylvatica TaxID=28930 RepID=A0A2N9I8A2_FAGSY
MDIALFSPSSLFPDEDDTSSPDETTETQQSYEERRHEFPGMELLIREFSFHQLNANLLWPGTFAFAECGTGALAIYLQKLFCLDITTSDYDDQEIEENIAHNCRANGITPILPHVKHTWGDTFPAADPDWDLIIASDILLWLKGRTESFKFFIEILSVLKLQSLLVAKTGDIAVCVNIFCDVKQYANLIKTLSFLLKSYKPKDNKAVPPMENEQNGEAEFRLPRPAFLMSWRRRIGKEDESLFFTGCTNAGLEAKHIGSRVYCIKPMQTAVLETI